MHPGSGGQGLSLTAAKSAEPKLQVRELERKGPPCVPYAKLR